MYNIHKCVSNKRETYVANWKFPSIPGFVILTSIVTNSPIVIPYFLCPEQEPQLVWVLPLKK